MLIGALALLLTTAATHAGSKKSGKPWMGVSMSRPSDGGVRVEHVFRTSPAAKAKIERGDRLTHADDVKLDEPRDLVEHVARHKPGMTIKITLERGDKTRAVPVTLAEHPGTDQLLRLMHVGREAYELSGLTPIQGDIPSSIKDLRGKVVLVDFFAGWCGNCKRMTPELARLERKYAAKGLRLLAITSDEEKRAREIVKSWGITYSVASDETKQTFSAYNVSAIPAVYIVGKKGKIREVVIGNDTSQRQATEKLIQKLLDEK